MVVRIKQLSSILANQIAAGEVIERPASVMKELLENAMDAGADHIQIEVDYGGLSRIKVSDNGRGIFAEDLPLAIAAHATSKIASLEDLYTLNSLGFRGEALASIASIAKMSIASKPENQAHGMLLQAESGQIALYPTARTTGTTVEVLDLFYNAPVRKKFLKSQRSEYQALEAIVRRFALSNPKIALSLQHNGKSLLKLPAANCEKTRLSRIKKLMGKAFLEEALYIHAEQGELTLHGWIGGSAYQRSQNDKQWFYINQRMVKDKLISHAVKQVYEPYLYPGRFPACLLYLSLPAGEVDVNVHPTKHEVRFGQPRLIHDFIVNQLSKALAGTEAALDKPSPRKGKVALPEVRECLSHYQIENESQSDFYSGWHVLNASFVLVTLKDISYLIDLAAVQQHNLSYRLKTFILPLASRPLLFPLKFNFPNKPQHGPDIELVKIHLARLGIEIDLLDDEMLLIRSIPKIIPNLQIEIFLDKIYTSDDLSEEFLLNTLSFCQSIDAYQLSIEEQNNLISFMQECIAKDETLPAWCLCLDEKTCRSLING